MKGPLDHARGLALKAANDLIAGRATFATGSAFDTVCFHAQQAVEKRVKAVLALHDVEYPWRHDLAELIELVKPLMPTIALYENEILDLTPFAVEVRYDAEFAPSNERAKEALETATKIHELIQAAIESAAPQIPPTDEQSPNDPS
jgi:HEPN domain-containing protein